MYVVRICSQVLLRYWLFNKQLTLGGARAADLITHVHVCREDPGRGGLGKSLKLTVNNVKLLITYY